jgi:type II secretion system protein D
MSWNIHTMVGQRFIPVLAALLTVAAGTNAPAQAPRLPAPARDEQPQRIVRKLQLRQATVEQFESGLRDLNARLVNVVDLPDGAVATYQLRIASGGELSIQVSRQSSRVAIEGPIGVVDVWARLLETLDARRGEPKRDATRFISLSHAEPQDLRRTISILEAAGRDREQRRPAAGGNGERRDPVSMILQLRRAGKAVPRDPRVAQAQPPREAPDADAQPDAAAQPERHAAQPADQPAAPAEQAVPGRRADVPGDFGLIGPVQIEYIEELDMIVVRGDPRDVEKVVAMIEAIDRETATTRPAIVVYPLRHVNNEALSTVVTTLYDQVLTARLGRVSITALVKPNALLLIGRQENVNAVIDLVRQLDQPVDPETQSETFFLKHASAAAAQAVLREFFGDRITFSQHLRTALGARLHVVIDYRTNSLVVQAGPRDMAEVRALLRKLDVAKPPNGAVNQVRIVKLQNSVAAELAPIINQAVAGPSLPPVRTSVTGQQQFGQQQPQQQQPGGQGTGSLQQQQQLQARSIMLQLLTVDADGQRRIESSGMLTDVRVTPDSRGNALVVSAPEESMDLVIALIEALDRLPPAESQIKVFTIVNADAERLSATLQQLFGQGTQQQPGQQGAFGFQQNVRTATAGEEGSILIPLRVAVERRSNSVIVSGSTGDLAVVEALLLKLDDADVRERQTRVHRLKNAPALDVSEALNQYLTTQRQVQTAAQGVVSVFEQIEREVIVVPEPVSNSLIVSATPRYFKEITELVEKLDERPPMVMIQVVLAEVTLNATDEFGIEVGIQDSVLFDRGISAATGTATPGFNFNNQPLANGVVNPARVGSQGLSNLSVGRINSELGFGGLVLSASGESVSALLRALQENRHLNVLSRPQVMTLDNQYAFVQVGARVPYITDVIPSDVGGGTSFSTSFEDVGVILGVTPRISPDGQVVMEIDATKSELGPIDQGVPISIAPNGDVIRSPQINITTARTTVMAANGQTVVLGGLITSNHSWTHRQVPFLGDIPVVGRLFSYDLETDDRTELLIIMTPHVVRNEADAAWIREVEQSRMSWCLGDVLALHEMGPRTDLGIAEPNVPTVYPDVTPGLPEKQLRPAPPLPPSVRPENVEPRPTPATPTPAAPLGERESIHQLDVEREVGRAAPARDFPSGIRRARYEAPTGARAYEEPRPLPNVR